MSNEKKMSVEEYNEIVKHFVNKTTPEPKKKKPLEFDACHHSYVRYTGLNKVEDVCRYCNKVERVDEVLPNGNSTYESDGI